MYAHLNLDHSTWFRILPTAPPLEAHCLFTLETGGQGARTHST